MNVNGSRFHLLLGRDDWAACGDVASKGIPSFDEKSGQLGLLPLVESIQPTPGEPLYTAADHRDAAADRSGNLYVIADDRFGLLVRSCGDRRTTAFWPPAPQAGSAIAPTFDDLEPAAATPETLTGLAITTGDFLVVGVAGAGLLRFDLVGGGAPERILIPAGIAATSLAASGDGGLWLLDAAAKRLLKLDRDLCIEAQPVPDEPPVFAPDGAPPAASFRAEPLTIDVAAAPAAAAIAVLADGSVILLDAPAHAPAGLFIVDPGASILTPLIRLDFAASCFTAVEKNGLPALLLADDSGNQARRVELYVHNARWRARPVADTLPLRRFGGRALVTIKGAAHYDSGATDPIWVPVVELSHRRFEMEAAFLTPVYDGREPQCVWDRVRLDGCIPAGASVIVEARGSDDAQALGASSGGGWVAQPALLLSRTGSELPDKGASATLPTDKALGRGTWELLLQDVVGRYAQLRVTLKGDGRVTPRLRALRLWYPRFSYVEKFLPGLYREEPASASFLERFLANFEGVNTRIEDRIATIEALFDPRTAPAGMLEWLASWFDVALDPSWDERRRRLFIGHAAAFFGWRGTVRGLQLALKLALDAEVDDADFDLEAAAPSEPRSIRIVEAFAGRTRGRAFSAEAGPAQGPGLHSLAEDWVPEEGAAGLWARWPDQPAPGGPFPLSPPENHEEAWGTLVQRQFGFIPVRVQGDSARWRDFLRARYRTAAQLDSAHGTSWGDFALAELPEVLPATPAAIRDWLMFEGQALPFERSAHRFSVLLPRIRADSDPAEEERRLALARRIVGLEKPAHTVFDIRFYWAMNRVGEARLGLDSAIGQGSRAPELVPGAVLGRAYVGAAFVGGPDAPPSGRERIAC
jgi:phage tail-like protein